ncbi:MAG TPA: hypothetical protein VG603_13760, partial [Chitinophagales bacterium]|nr:hypothetical protein [Chitinophagales bacterium]
MSDQTPLVALDISLKASLQDLAITRIMPDSGEISVYRARNYVYTTCNPGKEFLSSLIALEGLTGATGDYLLTAVIDIQKYYSNSCSLKVVAVGTDFNDKSMAVQISDDGKKILYWYNVNASGWSDINVTDSFLYTIKDTTTGEVATANINLSRYSFFVPNDVYIELNPLYSGIIRIDLRKFIDASLDFTATGAGIFDTNLISKITIDPQDPQVVIVYLINACCNWDCHWTDFEVFLRVTDSKDNTQTGSKIYINLIKQCEIFIANPIEIEISGDVPSFVEIDIARFNPHAFVELLQVGYTSPDKGMAGVNAPLNFVKYDFNRDSGFWSADFAKDIFEYSIRNRASGAIAKSYISIRKSGASSSSSYGAGGGINYATSYNIGPDTTLIKQGSTKPGNIGA